MSGDVNKIGVVIKSLRQNANLTQGQLAQYTGLSQSYISQLESGKHPTPSAQMLEKLADRLGVSVDDILTMSGRAAIPQDETGVDEMTALYRQLPNDMRGLARAVVRAIVDTYRKNTETGEK